MRVPLPQILGGRKVAAYEAAIDEVVRQVICPTCQALPRRSCNWSWALPLRITLSHVRRYDAAVLVGLVTPLSTEVRVKWQPAGAAGLLKGDI